ncbi:putative ABC transport system ATP-binding protein [Breznakia blatticola]|uniref:Putative ABC transport system ATP-binding protein n=1 Tax=Breznakia blatticola TaxID=1754012 RepID=A0A4R8A2X5_9FIRM|nr:ATP-binding cassette domain-containing protein [Breznakia blatticola]TDW24913.1 putative ABC transport system ATP-binding protein [Breznakia blatticola]
MSELSTKDLSFYYTKDKSILKELNLAFERGKIYAIVGKSGAGKTTLLSLLSQLQSPKDGHIYYEGQDISNINADHYRSCNIGVVFQSYNLLPSWNAIENVSLSLDIANWKESDKKTHAKMLLEKMQIDESDMHRAVHQLSGGQQQRVAIARAISYNPSIILADEPTGNLDKATEKEILTIFQQLAYEEDKCVILVTHASSVTKIADEIYRL